MKSLRSRLSLLALWAGLGMFGCPGAVCAAEGQEFPAERIERLEMRLNEIGERQEHFMREVGGQMDRLGEMTRAGREGMRQPLPPGQGMRPPMMPGGEPPAVKFGKAITDALRFCFFIGVICNILLAIWIFTDIRKRGEGSAIFVAVALLAGVPAALIYAITRIGDKKPVVT